MKKNILKNKKIKFHSVEEVFQKASKSETFKKEYSEELTRLTLASQIKELRIKNKLTQNKVAEKANMPQSVIARMESGEHSFSLGTLNRVAQVFNKKVELT